LTAQVGDYDPIVAPTRTEAGGVLARQGPVSPLPQGRNRLSPLRFVLAFGLVSLLADFVYEGARSVAGPFLAQLGAGAALVGLITGAGEAVAV
jgi:hypothetical protein